MPRTPRPGPAVRAWLRQEPGSPVRYTLRFEVDAGIGRLVPLPAHASAQLQRGTAAATVGQLDVHELFVIQLLTSGDHGQTWTGGPLLPDGGALLHDLPVGEWVPLSRPARGRSPSRTRPAPGTALPPEEAPTDVVLLPLDGLDDGLPPLRDDAPTDLNLLPPPMARLQALRRHKELAEG